MESREGRVGGRRHGFLRNDSAILKTQPHHVLCNSKNTSAMWRRSALTEFFKQSSSTSKLEVSVGLLTSGMYGASHVRMFSQSMPENKA